MTYKNFDVAMYLTTFDLEALRDLDTLEKMFPNVEEHIHVNKVYVETYRNGAYVSKADLLRIKAFFEDKNIKVSGGVTLSSESTRGFSTFCYSQDSQREEVLNIIEFTAKIFDEIILDDFYFDNCKCVHCIKSKGTRSWKRFRTEQLMAMSEKIVGTAKKVNPEINMIIKYPNWYESYGDMGYDLYSSSKTFDHGYVGTEIRDTHHTQQSLQPYGSYFITRYISELGDGYNMGGWFDGIDCDGDLKRYLEQLYLTLLAGAKEVTLFSLGSHLLWEDIFAPIAGYGFKRMDQLLSQLKSPKEIKAYKPFGSSDDYLLSMLGMLGIPVKGTPYFPAQDDVLMLTESAAEDAFLVQKIEMQLIEGKKVVITSGLLKALKDRNFKDIVNIEHTGRYANVDKIAVNIDVAAFTHYEEISGLEIPILKYHTNDYWAEIVGFSGENNYPILLRSDFGKGELIILNTPAVIGQLKLLPSHALTYIRKSLLKTYFEGPSDISFFEFEDHLVLMSFISHNQKVKLSPERTYKNIETGQMVSHELNLRPRSMTVLEIVEG